MSFIAGRNKRVLYFRLAGRAAASAWLHAGNVQVRPLYAALQGGQDFAQHFYIRGLPRAYLIELSHA